MTRVYSVLLGLLLVLPAYADTTQVTKEATPDNLVPRLKLVKNQNEFTDRVMLRLTIENQSDTSVAVIRLRSGSIEASPGWGGWQININGPDGPYRFIPHPGARMHPVDEDLIELQPGESFGTWIDIGQAARTSEPYPKLFETKGDYTIVVIYAPAEWLRDVTRKDVYRESIRSNTLELTIGTEQAD